VVLLAYLGLMARCYQLQVLDRSRYEDKSLRQQRSLSAQRASRGPILDSRGRILAASNQVRTVFAEPRTIADPKKTASRLSGVLQQGAHHLCKSIMDSRNPGYVRLSHDNVSWEQGKAARAIPGVGVQYDWQRYYPYGHLTAHLVGFTSRDAVGQGGAEYQYNDHLTGEGSTLRFLADHRRRPVKMLATQEGRRGAGHAGGGLILTLDATIQQFAREELSKRIAEYEAAAGIVIVAEPQTGAILAMVSLPDFDPAQASKTPEDTLRNRALVDMYEPGSVLKPIVAAIALNEKVINKTETIFCENGTYRGKGFGKIGEYNDKQYGDMNIREILMNSSNIGMAKVGQRLGPQRLCKGLKLFGFGAKTGIALPGEAKGQMIPASQLKLHSLVRVPFGHAISVTGLQLVRAYCVLANGGHLVKPHIVKSLVDEEGHPVKRDTGYEEAGTVGYIIDPALADWMVKDALSAVVKDGGGRRAKSKRWTVFGKTGTAQVPKTDGTRGYEENAYIASFIAGAPAEDPKIIVLVSIHRPNRSLGKGYSGGAVASPVVGRIIERTLSYYEARGLIAPPPEEDSPS
jgi:cell division protein FtsI/penicillin-binding protein 2